MLERKDRQALIKGILEQIERGMPGMGPQASGDDTIPANLAARVSELEGRVFDLENNVSGLHERIAGLEARLNAFRRRTLILWMATILVITGFYFNV